MGNPELRRQVVEEVFDLEFGPVVREIPQADACPVTAYDDGGAYLAEGNTLLALSLNQNGYRKQNSICSALARH